MKLLPAALLVLWLMPCGSAQTRATDSPVHLARGVIDPLLLKRVDPAFPNVPCGARVSGTIVVRAIIGKDGRVRSVVAVSGPDLARKPVVQAVRQWVYKPYVLNGKPTMVDTTIAVPFQTDPE